MRLLYLICLTAVLSFLSSCDQPSPSRAAHWDQVSVHYSHMDTTIRPGSDFYRYTNGGWNEHTQIPNDLPEYNTFYYLQNKVFNDLLITLEQLPSLEEEAFTAGLSQVALLYRQYLDTLSRNNTGITPILSVLKNIKKTQSKAALFELISTDTQVSAPFFTIEIGADLTNSTQSMVYLGPHTLGLGHRKDYFSSSLRAQALRENYKKYISSVLTEVDVDSQNTDDTAQSILKLEQLLAKAQAPPELLQQPELLNNRYAVKDANETFPRLALKNRLENWGIPSHIDTLIITQPHYFNKLEVLLDSLPLSQLKQLTVFHTVNSSSQIMSGPLEKKHWLFYKSNVQGARVQQPAPKRALQMVNKLLPEALGLLYAKRYGNEQTNARISLMITYIIAAYKKRIQALTWMAPGTKNTAIQKLDSMDIRVGYPTSWDVFHNLELTPDNSYYQNQIVLRQWSRKKSISLLNQNLINKSWRLFPHQVNAQYFPDTNQIIIPAALLQPPLYDAQGDMASNFGSIGAIIGHEITHAFDRIGARYDVQGNLNPWWTTSDETQFNMLTQALDHQYKAIELKDSLVVNAALTRNENIADLGGIATAFDALQDWIADYGLTNKSDDFTPNQRFFMAWTSTWRSKQRRKAFEEQLKVDTHLPGPIRAVQPLRQFSTFYEAFDIGPSDPEYLPIQARIPIW